MSENAKPVAWALLTSDGTLALCDRNETYVTLRRERYDEGWPHHAPHTVMPLYAHPPANSHQSVPSDQTAPVPPVVAVTDEMVERGLSALRKYIGSVMMAEASIGVEDIRVILTAALRPERGEKAQ